MAGCGIQDVGEGPTASGASALPNMASTLTPPKGGSLKAQQHFLPTLLGTRDP